MASDRGVAFEKALEELEAILAALDGGDLRLDEALQLFERGIGHLRAATRLLDDARGRVEELVADASGELRAAPFELPSDEEVGGPDQPRD